VVALAVMSDIYIYICTVYIYMYKYVFRRPTSGVGDFVFVQLCDLTASCISGCKMI